MTDVTAQAFREAADKERQRAVLSRKMGGREPYFHDSPLAVIQEGNALLLLAAAEQREQREQWDAERLVVDVITERQRPQIATLTERLDAYAKSKAEYAIGISSRKPFPREEIAAVLASMEQQIATLTAERDAARQLVQTLGDQAERFRRERDTARTLLADVKLHLT